MQTLEQFQVGDRVLILYPSYAAGKVGMIYKRESYSDDSTRNRWLIKVYSNRENIILSLAPNEFHIIQSTCFVL
jgi:hypothetical protein